MTQKMSIFVMSHPGIDVREIYVSDIIHVFLTKTQHFAKKTNRIMYLIAGDF